MNVAMTKESLPYSNESNLEFFLSCQDHNVSRETFNLYRDKENDLLITLPRPSIQELPGYYDSDDYNIDYSYYIYECKKLIQSVSVSSKLTLF